MSLSQKKVLSTADVHEVHYLRTDNTSVAVCIDCLYTNIILSHPGATLSQLSDSGQTLSEDSGVDIAEAGGLSKDGSPRPSKNQQGQLEQPGAHAPPPGTRQVRENQLHQIKTQCQEFDNSFNLFLSLSNCNKR